MNSDFRARLSQAIRGRTARAHLSDSSGTTPGARRNTERERLSPGIVASRRDRSGVDAVPAESGTGGRAAIASDEDTAPPSRSLLIRSRPRGLARCQPDSGGASTGESATTSASLDSPASFPRHAEGITRGVEHHRERSVLAASWTPRTRIPVRGSIVHGSRSSTPNALVGPIRLRDSASNLTDLPVSSRIESVSVGTVDAFRLRRAPRVRDDRRDHRQTERPFR